MKNVVLTLKVIIPDSYEIQEFKSILNDMIKTLDLENEERILESSFEIGNLFWKGIP